MPFPKLLYPVDRLGLEWTGPRQADLTLTWLALERYFKAVDPSFNAETDSNVNFMNMGVVAAGESALRILLGGVRADGELSASYSTPIFDDESYAAWLQADSAHPQAAAHAAAAWDRRDEAILEQLGVERGTRFLDIGCGRGQLLKRAAGRGAPGAAVS